MVVCLKKSTQELKIAIKKGTSMTDEEVTRSIEALTDLCDTVQGASDRNLISIEDAKEHIDLYLQEIDKLLVQKVF